MPRTLQDTLSHLPTEVLRDLARAHRIDRGRQAERTLLIETLLSLPDRRRGGGGGPAANGIPPGPAPTAAAAGPRGAASSQSPRPQEEMGPRGGSRDCAG